MENRHTRKSRKEDKKSRSVMESDNSLQNKCTGKTFHEAEIIAARRTVSKSNTELISRGIHRRQQDSETTF